MENKDFIVRLVKRFNELHGTRYRGSSESTQDAIENLLKIYTQEQLDKVVELTADSNKGLYGILNRYFVGKTLEENEVEQVIETAKEEPNQNAGGMTLGLIEKALAKVIVDDYVPQMKNDVEKQIITELRQFIKETYGITEKTIKYVIPETEGELVEVTHEKLEEVLQFVMLDEPVMLIGNAGTGKNVIVQQIAKLLNLEFYFSNAITQEFKLTGFVDANGHYHETQFYKAFKNGGVFMLDEIDASIPEVLVILNAAIANRYFDFPHEKVYAHKDFRIISAGNTFGTGASYTYVGRNQLDGASLDRFAVIEIDYSRNIENAITSNQNLLDFVRDFRRAVLESGLQHIVSYRALKRMDKLVGKMKLETIIKTSLTKNLEKDDLRMVIREMNVDNEWTTALREVK